MVKFSHQKDKLTTNFRENIKDIERLGLGKKEMGAPAGTVPVGDSGWYVPPDEPADPMNCDRWPNSPWCKVGAPDLKTPFELSIEPSVHQCGFDIEFTGTAFWLPLPTNKYAYRYEGECRNEPPPPPPPLPPFPGRGQLVGGGLLGDDVEVYALVTSSYTENIGFINEATYACTGERLICPGEQWSTGGTTGVAPITGVYTYIHPDGEAFPGSRLHYGASSSGLYEYFFNDFGRTHSYKYRGQTYVVNANITPTKSCFEYTDTISVWIYKGIASHIQTWLKAAVRGVQSGDSLTITVDQVLKTNCSAIERYRKNPPPEPPKKCNCMTTCCPDYSSLIKQLSNDIKKINNKLGEYPFNATIFDEDETRQEAQAKSLQIGNLSSGIRTTIDRVEKLAKIIGIDALPLEVPVNITDPTDSNIIGAVWNWLTGADKKKINNLFEYHVWMLEQFSAVLGHWQLEIKVEDTDQLKEGEQGIPTSDGEKRNKIALPDVATTLKELMLLQIQQYKTQGLILDVALKTLTESASTSQTAARTIAQIDEIVDFLDYPTNDASLQVPVQITVPGKDISQEDQNDLGKYLKPSTTNVRYDKWTKDQSLSDLLVHLATLIGSRGGAGQ